MKIPEELAVLRDAREAEAGISFDVAVRRFLRAEQSVVDKLLLAEKKKSEDRVFRAGGFALERNRLLVPVDILDERFLVIRSALYGAGRSGRSGSVFHCFIDRWTGDVLRHAGYGLILFDPVGHIFDVESGAGKLPYGQTAVPELPEGIRRYNPETLGPTGASGQLRNNWGRPDRRGAPIIPTLPYLRGNPNIPLQVSGQPSRRQTSFAKKERRQARRR